MSEVEDLEKECEHALNFASGELIKSIDVIRELYNNLWRKYKELEKDYQEQLSECVGLIQENDRLKEKILGIDSYHIDPGC